MAEEEAGRKRYVLSDKPLLLNPLCDQTFDTQTSPVQEVDLEPEEPTQTKTKPPKRKKGRYVEEHRKVYEFLKQEYLKRRGISIDIILLNIDPRMRAEEIEEYKKMEVNKRVKVLVDFWKQYFVKFESQHEKDKDRFVRRLKKHLKVDIAFTIRQDIMDEIKAMEERDAEVKVRAKEMENWRKLEEGKAILQKVLNLYYSFEKETLEDKEYMERLIWTYKEIKKVFPITDDELYNWWLEFPKKEEFKIDAPEKYTKDLIYKFFSQEAKFSRLKQLYKQVNKYSPTRAEYLIAYWKELKVSVWRYKIAN